MKLIKDLSGTPRVYPSKSDTIRLFPYDSIEINDKNVTKDMERESSLGLISIIDISTPKTKVTKEAVENKENGGNK